MEEGKLQLASYLQKCGVYDFQGDTSSDLLLSFFARCRHATWFKGDDWRVDALPNCIREDNIKPIKHLIKSA